MFFVNYLSNFFMYNIIYCSALQYVRHVVDCLYAISRISSRYCFKNRMSKLKKCLVACLPVTPPGSQLVFERFLLLSLCSSSPSGFHRHGLPTLLGIPCHSGDMYSKAGSLPPLFSFLRKMTLLLRLLIETLIVFYPRQMNFLHSFSSW